MSIQDQDDDHYILILSASEDGPVQHLYTRYMQDQPEEHYEHNHMWDYFQKQVTETIGDKAYLLAIVADPRHEHLQVSTFEGPQSRGDDKHAL